MEWLVLVGVFLVGYLCYRMERLESVGLAQLAKLEAIEVALARQR